MPLHNIKAQIRQLSQLVETYEEEQEEEAAITKMIADTRIRISFLTAHPLNKHYPLKAFRLWLQYAAEHGLEP